jgi:hypothetical protein
MAARFDPQDFGTSEDPYPAIHALRSEDPVHWSPELKSWIVTRYDDVRQVLLDTATYSEDRVRPFLNSLPPERRVQLSEMERLSDWLPFLSGDNHRRLRILTMKMFSQAEMKRMVPAVSLLVDELIDGFIERGTADFYSEFAVLLPGYVTMDLIGVPRSDFPRAKGWSDLMIAFMGGKSMTDKYQRVNNALVEMTAYFREQIVARKDVRGADLISHTLSAHEDEKLTVDELIMLCSAVIFAGIETTTALLTGAALSFARNPSQRRKLLENPDLTDTAVEECLRLVGPGGGLARIVAKDHEFGGKSLRKGDRVYVITSGANRDPAHFPDPDRFDIERSGPPHVAFGYGVHTCVGMWLARLEGRIAIPKLLARLGDYEITDKALDYGSAGVSRALQGLRIKFEPGPKLVS